MINSLLVGRATSAGDCSGVSDGTKSPLADGVVESTDGVSTVAVSRVGVGVSTEATGVGTG